MRADLFISGTAEWRMTGQDSPYTEKSGNRHVMVRFLLLVLAGLLGVLIFSGKGYAEKNASAADPPVIEWGGHVKIQGRISNVENQSIYKHVGTGYFADGACDFRLKNKITLWNRLILETHYEAVVTGGDTLRRTKDLTRAYPALARWLSTLSQPDSDQRRLMDLSKTIDKGNGYIFYHRLDRLSLSLQTDRGTLVLGRQALTWGNGMLFNPMDLFNPFSPTDVDPDYKIGDDMIRVVAYSEHMGELQMLYVPRRDITEHDVSWNASSLAGKLHKTFGSLEFDFMAAKHYRDYVFGTGSMGYIREAAWRVDVTWTDLDNHPDRNNYFSLDANLDYSWTCMKKNMYGFLEFFYNGLGENQYRKAVTDPALMERLERGELFTLGRYYLAGCMQLEVHPLVNVYLTLINNLKDPSGIIQPKLVWDLTQNFQINAGGTFYYGRRGSEYGGFEMKPYDFRMEPADSIYCILSRFF